MQQFGKGTVGNGPVIFWMNRDCRVEDNWGLLFAQELAQKNNTYLRVVYNLDPAFLGGGLRQLMFKIQGLQEVEDQLRKLCIPFDLLVEHETVSSLSEYILSCSAGAVVTDFSPLRIQRSWIKDVYETTQRALFVVDAHNIVPCWIASDKTEFGAYTIRPKIQKKLPEYLEEFPVLQAQKHSLSDPIEWDYILKQCTTDESIAPVEWIRGGSTHAKCMLNTFLEEKIANYEQRNDPNARTLSDLSPFLHYGHISAQRIALEVQKAESIPHHIRESFLEELIIRRELADNFCFYNLHYDSFEGFHPWAQKTLLEHIHDPREYLYTLEMLEKANTHDALWNAAQMEMVKHGKMHGYMRMYWAKKLLEWTHSPEEALRFGIYLNDKYELDGRDPNGYAGLAWSIGGVHDRAWGERDVFGKIRYMNANGCKRKFDTEAYIKYVESL